MSAMQLVIYFLHGLPGICSFCFGLGVQGVGLFKVTDLLAPGSPERMA